MFDVAYPTAEQALTHLATFTFTTANGGGGYEIRVEGSSTGKPWTTAFGLDKVDINTVSVFGTISSTKTGATTPPIAKKAVKKTRKNFKKAQRAIARAKDKCKEDLGPAWRLCDVMDAAEETLEVTKRGFKAAEDSLDGIRKSTSYLRLQAVTASLAAIKAGKSAADAAFSGWSAVDKVGQMVVAGGDLIEIEGLEFEGALRQLKGTIAVTANVGGAEVTETLKVDLTSPTPLDLVALADKIADEVTAQASKEGSPVYKALRKKEQGAAPPRAGPRA